MITTIEQARRELQAMIADQGEEAEYEEADLVDAVLSMVTDPQLVREFCRTEIGWLTAAAKRRIAELG